MRTEKDRGDIKYIPSVRLVQINEKDEREHVANRDKAFIGRAVYRTIPDSAATLLHLAHITELASGGTADVVAVAIKKYKKLRFMFACRSLHV